MQFRPSSPSSSRVSAASALREKVTFTPPLKMQSCPALQIPKLRLQCTNSSTKYRSNRRQLIVFIQFIGYATQAFAWVDKIADREIGWVSGEKLSIQHCPGA